MMDANFMYSFKSMKIFLHVAELLSYAEAGRVQGLSASAISKSIAILEDYLGVRLFHRTTRSIGLTQEGLFFYERCKKIINCINDTNAIITAKVDAPKGTLHLNVPHIFGHAILLPLLPKFRRIFPQIDLNIDFDDHVINIIKEGVDISIRSGELTDSRLIGYNIGDQHFIVCGSPYYFDTYGIPKVPSDLLTHSCIHFKYPSNGRIAYWAFKAPYVNLDLPNGITFNNSYAGLRAAIDGLGIAHLPVYIARDAIQSGLIKPILEEYMQPQGGLSLLWPSNRHLSPKIRSFVDFITEELRTSRQLSQLNSR